MNVELTVVDITPRGVKVVLGSTDAPAFWLPRTNKAVIWSRDPEPGASVTVRVPQWLVSKHGQLLALRNQRSISFAAPVELDPNIANREGSLPMSEHPQDIGEGVLFKNREKSKPSQPDYFGKAEVRGVKLRVSAWVKDSKKNPGQKFMSLSFRLDDTQEQPGQQRRPAGGQSFAEPDIWP